MVVQGQANRNLFIEVWFRFFVMKLSQWAKKVGINYRRDRKIKKEITKNAK